MRVSKIRVKQISVNQGLGVISWQKTKKQAHFKWALVDCATLYNKTIPNCIVKSCTKSFFFFQICLHSTNHSLYSCGPDNDLCFRSLLVWITTKSFSFQASKCDLISWLKTGSLFLHFSGQLTSSLVRLQCTVDNLVDNLMDNLVDNFENNFEDDFWDDLMETLWTIFQSNYHLFSWDCNALWIIC